MSSIDDTKARAARDVGIEAVVEQQKMGGRMPSQREAEDFVATILPRALEDAQSGVDASRKAPRAIEAKPSDGVVSMAGYDTECDVELTTGAVANARESNNARRDRLRRELSSTPEMMAIRARFKVLCRMPEWKDRIARATAHGWKWEKLEKILADSNSIPGLGHWADIIRGYDHKIYSGAGGMK